MEHMVAYIKSLVGDLLQIDFVRFCLVGASGFTINFILLTLLYKHLGLHAFVAQLISGEVALFSNFMLHHHWTYNKKNVVKSIKQLLWQFHATSWIAILGSALIVSVCIHTLHLNYILALVISSVIALAWNFLWSKYYIWKHHLD